MLVRDIPPGERPMDRLARLGPQALRDTELLAIIFGGQTALQAAELVLHDGLARLHNRAQNPQLSEKRKAQIRAVLELAKRLEATGHEPARVVERPSDIAFYLEAKYAREPQERAGVVLLDFRHRVIAEREVYIGQHNVATVSTRWLLKQAITEDAKAIILFHNHPSGDPRPSLEDSELTASLKGAGEILDVELFDHIIIGRKSYYSFREEGRV